MQKAIEEGQDIKSSTQIVELSSQRMMVKDTDKGRELVTQINDLKKLLLAYRMGLIKEKEGVSKFPFYRNESFDTPSNKL